MKNGFSDTRAYQKILELNSVSKMFGEQKVVCDVDLELRRHDYVSIVGPSGCGKSTLLHLMAGLERPTSGSIKLVGIDLVSSSPEQVDAIRLTHCAFVFQFFHLLPVLTVLENVCLPAIEKRKKTAAEIVGSAHALLSRLGLEHAMNKLPQELSGGMQSRVGFARAILMEPDILFADEPTGSLDSASGENLLRELEAHQERTSCALVLVTHDRQAARRASKQLRMQDGRLLSADQVLGHS